MIRWFDTLSSDDVALVGGKNASLGELTTKLAAAGVRVPHGFATTADVFWSGRLNRAGEFISLSTARRIPACLSSRFIR